MKILLIAVNAKYIHSNLAVYSLQAYARQQGEEVSLREFTVNQQEDEILREIYREKPDVAAFSVYIWNVEYVRRLAADLHAVLPETAVWFGGPEVSFDARKVMEELPFLSGILIGEGEAAFAGLCRCLREKTPRQQRKIPGLLYREADGSLADTGEAHPLPMDELPFPCGELKYFRNRIIYYESSRGCPFSCTYCLSSLDRKLRYRSLELVFRELSFFLEKKVRQVKFVDRTFNADRERAAAIWRFLRERDNGVTNFHFEIEAELLDERGLSELAGMRPGLVQLEIGVQTTNQNTLAAIRRHMDFEKLARNVRTVRGFANIHQHLDLIAGLPEEDLESFAESFREVYALRPQQLQLGFLKVLKGTPMAGEQKKWEIRCKGQAPYEVLGSRWLSYGDILQLKLVEEMVEVYYNSGQFQKTLEAAENWFRDPFSMYRRLGAWYEEQGYLGISHSRIRRYEILAEFFQQEFPEAGSLLRECMIYDLYARENLKARPAWAGEQSLPRESVRRFYEKEAEAPEFLKDCGSRDWRQLKSMTHLEEFLEEIPGFPKGRKWLLFDYQTRNALDGSASVADVTAQIGTEGPEKRGTAGLKKGEEQERMEKR